MVTSKQVNRAIWLNCTVCIMLAVPVAIIFRHSSNAFTTNAMRLVGGGEALFKDGRSLHFAPENSILFCGGYTDLEDIGALSSSQRAYVHGKQGSDGGLIVEFSNWCVLGVRPTSLRVRDWALLSPGQPYSLSLAPNGLLSVTRTD